MELRRLPLSSFQLQIGLNDISIVVLLLFQLLVRELSLFRETNRVMLRMTQPSWHRVRISANQAPWIDVINSFRYIKMIFTGSKYAKNIYFDFEHHVRPHLSTVDEWLPFVAVSKAPWVDDINSFRYIISIHKNDNYRVKVSQKHLIWLWKSLKGTPLHRWWVAAIRGSFEDPISRWRYPSPENVASLSLNCPALDL